jgi:MFS transporter, DHA1 family, inner membrane transport protein
LGALVGPVVGTRLSELLGSWQVPFYAFGVAGLLIAAAVAVFIPTGFSEARETGGPDKHVGQAESGVPRVLNRNVCLAAASFALVGVSFFSYTALYATFLREHLNYSAVGAGSSLGMYGLGATCAIVGGWAGDRLGRPGIYLALAIFAATSFFMFNAATRPVVHDALSFTFGLLVSGFFYARFSSIIQRSARPDQIGYAMSAAMAGFYLSWPFAGYLFGRLVELAGWATAANIMVVAPPCVAIVLMSLVDFNRIRDA